MLKWLNRRRDRDRIARALYGSSVAAARRPAFYLDHGVPDTVAGRFELLVLHLFLMLDRLREGGEPQQGGEPQHELARELSEQMFEALDDAMREMGVGDLTVPKKMHKVAGAFYGRLDAYAAALASADPLALEGALKRNVYGEAEVESARIGALATYVRSARRELARADTAGLIAGEIDFPAIGEAER